MEETNEGKPPPKRDPIDQKTGPALPPEISRDAVAIPQQPGAPGSALRVVGNILWLILGGIWMAVGYSIAGLIMFVTIIGIPFGIQAFKLAGFSLWPFGRVMVRKTRPGTGSLLGNILWFIFAGFWLALGHLVSALFFALTIIGIPFAVVSIRLAEAALLPFGREVVSLTEARSRGGW
jgi:uncharacterized membrane protein YccF (DUF307 family)